MKKLKNLFICVLMAVCIFLASFSIHYYKVAQTAQNPPQIEYITDTITVTKDSIIEKTKTIYIEHWDTTVIYEKEDKTDSVKIDIPIEHKTYKDTIKSDSSNVQLEIQYSGFKPSLDSIHINYSYLPKQYPIIKKNKAKMGKSFNIGLQTGYGGVILPDGTVRLAPYIGVGGSFGFGITF